VEMHDERFTTRLAQRIDSGGARRATGGAGAFATSEDSRAAAHLLESWLAARSR